MSSCAALETGEFGGAGLGQEELQLLDVNPPQDRIDPFWIRQTEELIAGKVKSIQDLLVGENRC